MYDIPQLSLKVAPMQFATFTPTQYTPQVSDATLLAKSMTMQESRQDKARQNLDVIDTTLASARDSLNVAEHDWLNQQANDIRAAIDEQLDLGNWQSAIRIAQEYARDLKRNTELQDKINVNKIYNTERNKIQSGNYSSYTKRRWDDVNKYNYNGTSDWSATFNPVTDISIADIWNLAVNRTPVRSNSSNWSKTRNDHTFVDNNGNLVTKITEDYEDAQGNKNTRVADGIIGIYSTNNTTKGGNSSIQEKRESDIISTFKNMLKDSNIRGTLRQEFDNMIWLYDKANEVINNPNSTVEELKQAKADLDVATNSLSNREGFIYVGDDESFEAWIDAQASQYAKDSAYRHKNTGSTDNLTTSYDSSSLAHINANRNAINANLYSPGFATTQGVNITYTAVPNIGGYNAGTVMQLLYADKQPNNYVELPNG